MSLEWDRLKHYFLINAGLTTVGATLTKGLGERGPSLGSDFVVACVFMVGAFAAALGILSLLRSREYYRVTVFKKTLIEGQLGYHEKIAGGSGDHACLAIGTTRGMRENSRILAQSEDDLRRPYLQPGSLVFHSALVLGIVALLDVGCASYLVLRHAYYWVQALLSS